MSSEPPRLVTIPLSHFCEKARWALERAGIPYEEEAHLQLIHRFAARRAGGGRQVPVLVTPGQVITQSSRIIRWADQRLPEERRLVPAEHAAEIDELERHLDDGFGVQARRWMYSVVMQTDLPRRFGLEPMPRWEQRLLPVAIPPLKFVLRRFMDAGPDAADDALANVDRSFDEIEAMLADGRRYLVGGRFSSADLTFAALSAAVLMPERYGVRLPQPEDAPAEIGEQVLRLRERPAGKFAARIVAEERPWPPANRQSAVAA